MLFCYKTVIIILLSFLCNYQYTVSFSYFSECNMGKWVCVEDKCSSSCNYYGFGHIDTFDGKSYEFEPSPCSYFLVQVRVLDQLDIV